MKLKTRNIVVLTEGQTSLVAGGVKVKPAVDTDGCSNNCTNADCESQVGDCPTDPCATQMECSTGSGCVTQDSCVTEDCPYTSGGAC